MAEAGVPATFRERNRDAGKRNNRVLRVPDLDLVAAFSRRSNAYLTSFDDTSLS